MDADAMVKYPRIGHTTRIQIEAADAILLNKVDLVSASELKAIEESYAKSMMQLKFSHPAVPVGYGLAVWYRSERVQAPPEHIHQPEFESFYTTHAAFNRQCFEEFVDSLGTGNPCQRFSDFSQEPIF